MYLITKTKAFYYFTLKFENLQVWEKLKQTGHLTLYCYQSTIICPQQS